MRFSERYDKFECSQYCERLIFCIKSQITSIVNVYHVSSFYIIETL